MLYESETRMINLLHQVGYSFLYDFVLQGLKKAVEKCICEEGSNSLKKKDVPRIFLNLYNLSFIHIIEKLVSKQRFRPFLFSILQPIFFFFFLLLFI